MPIHPLTNFEIQRYYENESKFNGVYSRNNLSEIMNGAYTIKIDHCKSIGAHWITLYLNGNNVTYFDSFGVKHFPKKKLKSS